MKKLDPANKTCIYLDQFVISDLVDETNELWREIKKLLEISYKNNKIYCPLSPQHFIETSRKKINDAISHDEYFRKLSDNYLFKDELFLTTQLISSLIRNHNHTLQTFLQKVKVKEMKDVHTKLNEHYNIFDESVNHGVSFQNQMRKILNNGNFDKKIETDFINIIKGLEVKKFTDRLEEYLKKGFFFIRPDNFGQHQFPNWIDQILYVLTNKHQFKEKEFKKLLKELKSNGFDRIPPLNIRFSLGAYIAVKGKQEHTNDHIDIMRITNSFFSSDIFFTDKQRKFEITQLKLDKSYKTDIYSGTETDLKEVKKYLEELNS